MKILLPRLNLMAGKNQVEILGYLSKQKFQSENVKIPVL